MAEEAPERWEEGEPPALKINIPTPATPAAGFARRSRRETVRPLTVEQADEIDALRASTQQLREQLLAEKQRQQLDASQQQRNSAMPLHAELVRLQDSAEAYARKIDAEKRRLEQLDAQLAEVDAELAAQRSRTGPYFSSEEAQAQAAKGLAILEARLVTAQRRRNESAHANAQARAAIDALRLQRLGHARLAAKLQRQLDELRAEMRALVVSSAKAYTAREQARADLAAIGARAGVDAAASARAPGALAEAEARGRGRGGGGGGERRVEPLPIATVDGGAPPPPRQLPRPPSVEPSQPWAGARSAGARRVRRSSVESEQGGSESGESSNAGALVDSYEATFRQIVAVTGVASLEELAAFFESEDEARAAQHARAHALGEEAAKLEEAIVEVRAEVEKFKGQGALNDAHRRRVQDDLSRRLAAADEAAALYEARAQTALRTLSALKGGVGLVFSRLGCDTAEALQLVGGGGVTTENLMTHLGLIEQRAHELLQMYAAAQAHALAAGQASAAEEDALLANAMGAMLGPGPHVPPGASRVQIVPPSTSGGGGLGGGRGGLERDELSDENDEEPEDARPFSRDELRARTIRALARKEKRQAAAAALARGRAAGGDGKGGGGKDKEGAAPLRAGAGYRAAGGARLSHAEPPAEPGAPARAGAVAAAAAPSADKKGTVTPPPDDDARAVGRGPGRDEGGGGERLASALEHARAAVAEPPPARGGSSLGKLSDESGSDEP